MPVDRYNYIAFVTGLYFLGVFFLFLVATIFKSLLWTGVAN